MPENTADKTIVPFTLNRELRVQFPLIEEFFRYGQQIFGGLYNGSPSNYFQEGGNPDVRIRKLPPKYTQLALDNSPIQYYVVYFDDRRDEYYKENRGRSICISTHKKSSESNSLIREVTYQEDASGMSVTTRETVNAYSFRTLNTADSDTLETPNGSKTVTYKLRENGEPILQYMFVSRMDEVFTPYQGESRPARLHRSMEYNRKDNITTYSEQIILNRSRDIQEEVRIYSKILVEGTLEDPQGIVFDVGFGFWNPADEVVIDKDRNIRIVVEKGCEGDAEVLKQDPEVAFLFESNPDPDHVNELLRNKIKTIVDHWDKPTSVFETSDALEGPKIE